MNKVYILKKQKLIKGPYDLAHLKKIGLKETDLVWFEGLSDWTPVKDTDLFAALPQVKEVDESTEKNNSVIHRLYRFFRKAI
jgi:hypothetical protein